MLCWPWVNHSRERLPIRYLLVSIRSTSTQSFLLTRRIFPEQLSHELALRFASKCFTHLEITHFKDNFKSLADHQDGIEYWKEDTLCRFLCLPDALQVGSVIYQMATYLGAFPFPSLAPCILTRDAMIKVVTVMTERYGKVLKRGKRDRIRLLFRSLAVFDRTTNTPSALSEKPTMEQLVEEQKPDDMVQEDVAVNKLRSHVAGFAIDEPVNDDLDEDEDDDELALAALDSLDAIEVFKQDQMVAREKKIHHAQIPVEIFKRFLMLLLVLGPLGPQENMAKYGEDLSEARLQELENEVKCMVAAFDPDKETGGIRYAAFTRAISSAFPLLFDPLNALFEHFLFSKNIDLARHRDPATSTPTQPLSPKINPIVSESSEQSTILTPALVSHLSTFLITKSTSSSPVNLFHTRTRFHPVYSTIAQGTSLTSFSRHVMSWQSATLLLVSGTTTPASQDSTNSSQPITIGAFLPAPWFKSSSSTPHDSSCPQSILFLLSPRHCLFPHNPYNRTSSSITHFSPKSGIALGCIIPPRSRASAASQLPVLGPVSLKINTDISTAVFQHDPSEGLGAFLPDPGLEKAQASSHGQARPLGTKVEFDIDTLEVWGVANPEGGEEEDEAVKQKKRLEWEEAEAARRAGINFGGDKDAARALLEMAGLVGDRGRSGGSV
jgi:TLD